MACNQQTDRSRAAMQVIGLNFVGLPRPPTRTAAATRLHDFDIAEPGTASIDAGKLFVRCAIGSCLATEA